MVMWSFGQCHTGTIGSGQLPKADPPNGEKNPWSTMTSERRVWMSSSYKGWMWSQAGESDLPWGGWLDVVWQNSDAQGRDSGHGSISIRRQVPQKGHCNQEALISQCLSAASWCQGQREKRKKEQPAEQWHPVIFTAYLLQTRQRQECWSLWSCECWNTNSLVCYQQGCLDRNSQVT